jgi:multicomponent Na+:H+ antiporter subunit C
MTVVNLYALVGVGLLCLGLYALIANSHLLRKIMAFNIMGSGVFLILVALAKRLGGDTPDPVPHAMVITGIVVAVSATALALVLMLKLLATSGRTDLQDTDLKE